MKNISLILTLSLIFLAVGGCAREAPPQPPQPLTFTQLASSPEGYDGKEIIIEGFYFQGFEVIVLSESLEPSGYAPGHLIPSGMKLWIESGIPQEVIDNLYEQHMMGPSEHYGKIRVRGIFESGGGFGHLGQYDYRITPREVELLPWSPPPSQAGKQETALYGYRVVNSYPHDSAAFTQGLVFRDGIIYEGTGLNGHSSLRKVALETGRVLEIRELPREYFGEGITVFGDIIVQLTWQSRIGFLYDRETLQPAGSFSYATEGWGLTNDGKQLIMSDGTATLYFIDPVTFQVSGKIDVHRDGVPVDRLNELEYINGLIYANIWQTDNIAIINPGDGRVEGWIDLAGLLPPQSDGKPVDVLNGIAYDELKDRLFVTGKLWPWLFEIELIEKE